MTTLELRGVSKVYGEGSTEVHADMKRLNLRGVEKGPNEKSIEDILLDAGCLVGPSGCSACLGGRQVRARGVCLGCWHVCLDIWQWEGIEPPERPTRCCS